MPDRKVHVYESSDHEYRVEPPLIEVKQTTDTLKIRNHSNDNLLFYVDAGPFHAANAQVTPLPPKSLTTIGSPILQGSSGAQYSFHVINPKNGKKAKANSDPVIIVDN
jgi:hypothetical protein